MSEFLNMGGYAAFVWSSYGIWLVVMIVNYVQPKWREKKVINELVRRHRLKQKNDE